MADFEMHAYFANQKHWKNAVQKLEIGYQSRYFGAEKCLNSKSVPPDFLAPKIVFFGCSGKHLLDVSADPKIYHFHPCKNLVSKVSPRFKTSHLHMARSCIVVWFWLESVAKENLYSSLSPFSPDTWRVNCNFELKSQI